MSTRRIATGAGEVVFDHGAQYFTVRDPGFCARVNRWAVAGCVAPWAAAGDDAYVGVPGMNEPIREMAEPFGVLWNVQVKALLPAGGGWRLITQSTPPIDVDALVVALPAEQAAALAEPVAPELAARGRAVSSAPCWTVMLAFAEALPTAADCIREDKAGAVGWAARNSAKPGRAGPEAWVIQASPQWSRQYFEAEAGWVVSALSAALSARLGVDLPPSIGCSTHRWRYARPGVEGSGALWDADRRIGLCGDWLIAPRIEAAWMSGTMLAERIGGSGC
jgi:predicted NAD/FAD-dependent oxidoreductase